MNLDRLRSSFSAVNGEQVRKLAPVVALLLVAVIAIPLLLGHSGRAAAVAPLPPAPTVTAPAPGALVAAAPSVRPNQTALHSPAHNPFVQKAAPAASGSSHTIGSSTPQTATLSAPAATSSPASAATSKAAPTAAPTKTVTHTVTVTVPAKPTTPARHHARHSSPKSTHPIQRISQPGISHPVASAQRFSAERAKLSIYRKGSGQPARVIANVARDQLLPSNHQALLAFLGIRSDRRTAVFILPKGVTASGQGACSPSRNTCTYLLLTPGQRAMLSGPEGSTLTGTWVLRYESVHRVTASGSIVNVNSFGARMVKQAAAYVPHLKSVHYEHFTGLLQITLGALQKVGL